MPDKELTAPKQHMNQLTTDVAHKYGVSTDQMLIMVGQHIISLRSNDAPASAPEVAMILSVIREYGLNPLMKQLHAWRGKGGKLTWMVGYDGWLDFLHRQPTYISHRFVKGEVVDVPGADRKSPEFITCYITKMGPDGKPIEVEGPEAWLKEWYVSSSEPWKLRPSNRLRQKALCLAVREIYGFGVNDEIDADNLRAMEPGAAGEIGTAQTLESLTTETHELAQKVGDAPEAPHVDSESVEDAEYQDVLDELDGPPEPDEASQAPDTPPPEDTTEEPNAEVEDDTEPEDGVSMCYAFSCGNEATFICAKCEDPCCEDHRCTRPGHTDCCIMCGVL